MKKRHSYLVLLTVCSMLLLAGCGKENTKKNPSFSSSSNNMPSTLPAQTTTAAPENAPKVNLTNLTITAGSEIDYMSAIEAVENMDLSKSMVYVNSSGVDRFTPGNYTVYYTFDYMGYTVKSFIIVTVLENTEETSFLEEPTAESTPAETTASEIPSSIEQETTAATSETSAPESSASETSPTASEQNTETTSSTNNTSVLDATIYNKDTPIPDAVFTLSTGETVTIKNTSERYIVETFTDDIYYTEDGHHFLRSELKILLNTGEIQTIETVITRVNSIPEGK